MMYTAADLQAAREQGRIEERREHILAALLPVSPHVQCRINDGPWGAFTFTAVDADWHGVAALSTFPSMPPSLGRVRVEVALWGIRLIGDAMITVISIGGPGDGVSLVGLGPLHPGGSA